MNQKKKGKVKKIKKAKKVVVKKVKEEIPESFVKSVQNGIQQAPEEKEYTAILGFAKLTGNEVIEPPLQYAVLGSGGSAPVINSFNDPLEHNVGLAKRYILAGYKWHIMDDCERLCFRVTMFKAQGEEVRGAVLLFGYRDYIWWGGGVDGLAKKLKEVQGWFEGLSLAGYNMPKPEEVPYQ